MCFPIFLSIVCQGNPGVEFRHGLPGFGGSQLGGGWPSVDWCDLLTTLDSTLGAAAEGGLSTTSAVEVIY
jgi:hypothetical protein